MYPWCKAEHEAKGYINGTAFRGTDKGHNYNISEENYSILATQSKLSVHKELSRTSESYEKSDL